MEFKIFTKQPFEDSFSNLYFINSDNLSICNLYNFILVAGDSCPKKNEIGEDNENPSSIST